MTLCALEFEKHWAVIGVGILDFTVKSCLMPVFINKVL